MNNRFLVPEVRVGPDGELIEMRPVKALDASSLRLSFALIDRLHAPVGPARPKDRMAHPGHLAEVANVDLETFERDARRIQIHRSREEWEMTVDGVDGAWTAPRQADELGIAEAIIEILGTKPAPEPDDSEPSEETL